jgi:hypothetical protein
MALITAESFERFGGDTADSDLVWTRSGSTAFVTSSPTPRSGSYCIRAGIAGTGGYWERTLPSSYATLILGFGLYVTSLASGPLVFLELYDSSGNLHLYFTWETSGLIKAYHGTGTLLGTSSGGALTNATWYYIEIKSTINDSTGAVTIRVNETTTLTVTGADTRNGGTADINKFRLRNNLGNTSQFYDDLYVCDTSGSNNNDFLGACVVEWRLPSGAGNYTQWTPSTGANYACADETDPNNDTDYVSDATTGNKDTYALTDLATTGGTVRGVVLKAFLKKTDANTATFNLGVRSSTTDSWGSNQSPTTSYASYEQVVETDPATSAAWTIAGVNAVEVGIRNNS